MAERRMFAKSVVHSGRFVRLPGKIQALYFQLGMFADDDGFVPAPEFAMQATGTTKRDLDKLEEEGLVYRFPGGLLLIRHWFTHNTIQKDRFRPTVYQEELGQVILRNRVYEMIPACIQNGTILDPQIKQNKNKQNEIKSGEENPVPGSPRSGAGGGEIPTLPEVICFSAEHNCCCNPVDFFNHYAGQGWTEGGSPVRDWRALLLAWERRTHYAGTP